MNCPNCHSKMEVENLSLIVDCTLEELKKYPNGVKQIPAAHYYCDNCDSEWSWIKGVKGIKFIDGRDEPKQLDELFPNRN